RTNIQHYSSMIQRSVANEVERPNATITNNDRKKQSIDRHFIETENDTSANPSAFADGELPSEGLEHYLQEQETQLIITALKQTGGNKTQAAELLGTTFRSLRYRMKKLEIDENYSKS
ncbi:MAG: helix-turn-helix domain-containing protein, partial [Psychrobacter sp.]